MVQILLLACTLIQSLQQKKDVSTKGAARGRTKPTYHFWTKTKIKTYIAKTRAYRVHVKKQIDAKPIRNYNRGEHRHQWKWLPSAYEKQLEDEEAAKNAPAKKSKKKARKKDKDGDEEEMDDNDEEGEDGEEEDEEEAGEEEEKAEGGGDAVEEEEEEFMFPGMMCSLLQPSLALSVHFESMSLVDSVLLRSLCVLLGAYPLVRTVFTFIVSVSGAPFL